MNEVFNAIRTTEQAFMNKFFVVFFTSYECGLKTLEAFCVISLCNDIGRNKPKKNVEKWGKKTSINGTMSRHFETNLLKKP
jgi:hypothetical protein